MADLIVTKSFSPSKIKPGGTSVLTITVNNPNGVAETGISFNDVYPTGLVNKTPSGVSATQGTPVAVDGGNSLSWSLGSLAPSSTAIITINVTSTTKGTYINNTGNIDRDESSQTGASATLTVRNNRNAGMPFLPTNICIKAPNPQPAIMVYGVRYNFIGMDNNGNACYTNSANAQQPQQSAKGHLKGVDQTQESGGSGVVIKK